LCPVSLTPRGHREPQLAGADLKLDLCSSPGWGTEIPQATGRLSPNNTVSEAVRCNEDPAHQKKKSKHQKKVNHINGQQKKSVVDMSGYVNLRTQKITKDKE